ncbi:membrane protein insertase YidC [Clostridium luticellarii]|jgi:YidC/Oxa1 family membrane protein insertase|uniref:Membrane protein insertase YidC n=1 Tax=Clostridium luticellarii TaxID=1691940 RepID=A0A2T0B5F9_9CLOT|nr:membrane protein insertase YidC [Clostridium luticellarii]PRR79128.1 Membrane protein insertase YidC [Clostridium luticellarii]
MNIIFNLLNTLLHYLFNLTGDLGIAIVLLTVTVRIVLLPVSIKQKTSIVQQHILSKKISGIKEKYKNNKKKLESEMQKYYRQSTKSMLGCFVSLLQLPIISSLYFVIIKVPVNVGTIIIPWIASIKTPDKYFIIPLIYALISLSPNLLSYIKYLKTVEWVKMTKSNLIFIIIFSIFITIKAPVAIGLYFITTSLFSLFEEIGYRLYMKDKPLN